MAKDRPRFQNILVDEVQDLNPEEMDVVLSLAGGKIFAVAGLVKAIPPSVQYTKMAVPMKASMN